MRSKKIFKKDLVILFLEKGISSDNIIYFESLFDRNPLVVNKAWNKFDLHEIRSNNVLETNICFRTHISGVLGRFQDFSLLNYFSSKIELCIYGVTFIHFTLYSRINSLLIVWRRVLKSREIFCQHFLKRHSLIKFMTENKIIWMITIKLKFHQPHKKWTNYTYKNMVKIFWNYLLKNIFFN